ncbi:unnamed protein product [Pylaiella littoralis]
MTELCPTEPGSQQDSVVLSAKAHAASIRRTLLMREYKREHGRAMPPAGRNACKPQQQQMERRHKLGKRDDPSPIVNGPIYSTEYWRKWKHRSRAGARAGSGGGTDTPHVTERSLSARTLRGTRRRSLINAHPTSSFAGGRHRTQIFAVVSGGRGGRGDSLLRAHHDAVIQPLLKGRNQRAARDSSSSPGVRLSHNDPRPMDVNSSKRSAGDGMHDIAMADKVVMRAASSCSFRAGAGSSSETAIQGLSRDTPGPIYDPNIGGSSAPTPATLFSPADRFPVAHTISWTPGPGHYNTAGDSVHRGKRPAGPGAVAWTGVETFMDSEWCRPVPPPHLRPWQGFGSGCNVQEHIDYGACLDGRCCTRNSFEQKNALRVVQFLGRGQRPGRRRDRGQRQGRSANEKPIVGSSPGDNGTFDEATAASPNVSRGMASAGVLRPPEARAAVRKRTPLHFASERGELALVDSRLCCQGDDRNAVDERGFTPLHDAADKGNTRVINRLLLGDEDENTALPAGAKRGARAVAKQRPRQFPANPDAQDDKGRTSLYLACLRGHERAVRALLKAGACPDLVDIRGKPAQEVAGAQRIYQLLQFKADVSLVKANIAALEERERVAERLQQEAAQAEAVRKLADLKAEELRLRAAVDALEKKRVAYATAAKTQR